MHLAADHRLDDTGHAYEFDDPSLDLVAHLDLHLARWTDPETGVTLAVVEVASA